MLTCRQSKPGPSYVDRTTNSSLEEVLALSKQLLTNLIDGETVHFNTRATWKCYLEILNHNFCMKSTIEFWDTHLCRMYKFLQMSPKAQGLFLRVFTWQKIWHTTSRVGEKYMTLDEVEQCVNELHRNGFVDVNENIELNDLLDLMQVEDLKNLCKTLRITPPNTRQSLIEGIKRHCKSQTSFFSTQNFANHAIKLGRDILGNFFRLEKTIKRLLLAILTTYCPQTMNSKRLLDNSSLILQRDFYRALQIQATSNLDSQISASSIKRIDIYPSVEQLFEYVDAMQIEERMLRLAKTDSEEVFRLAKGVKRTLLAFIEPQTESGKRILQHYIQLPDYQLKFTPPWIYTRCLRLGAEAAQRLKKFRRANNIFGLLLNREVLKQFNHYERGALYCRVALNFHHHLKNSADALKICQVGLADVLVSDKHKLELQTRAKSIDKTTPDYITLASWKTVKIVGNVLRKRLGDSRVNRFVYNNQQGDIVHCSVEEIALRHFLEKDYTEGFHVEDRAWHFIYVLVFCDIIYDYQVEKVWISELQTHPLDRHSAHFYLSREQRIVTRINEVQTSPKKLSDYIKLNYNLYFGSGMKELDWGCFDDLGQVERFLACCPMRVLLQVFWRFSRDNRNLRSGFPDLVVWNSRDCKFAVIEVKGPGDSLSDKQRLCLDFFVRNGVEAILCIVQAKKK